MTHQHLINKKNSNKKKILFKLKKIQKKFKKKKKHFSILKIEKKIYTNYFNFS